MGMWECLLRESNRCSQLCLIFLSDRCFCMYLYTGNLKVTLIWAVNAIPVSGNQIYTALFGGVFMMEGVKGIFWIVAERARQLLLDSQGRLRHGPSCS